MLREEEGELDVAAEAVEEREEEREGLALARALTVS